MADLKEEIKWENGIYQLETVDLVVGGVDGISNKQAKQLANRTSYLKKQIEDNKSGADLALATKRDVNDSYSKTEVDKKFTDTGKLIKEKLGKSETAAGCAAHLLTHRGFPATGRAGPAGRQTPNTAGAPVCTGAYRTAVSSYPPTAAPTPHGRRHQSTPIIPADQRTR